MIYMDVLLFLIAAIAFLKSAPVVVAAIVQVATDFKILTFRQVPLSTRILGLLVSLFQLGVVGMGFAGVAYVFFLTAPR